MAEAILDRERAFFRTHHRYGTFVELDDDLASVAALRRNEPVTGHYFGLDADTTRFRLTVTPAVWGVTGFRYLYADETFVLREQFDMRRNPAEGRAIHSTGEQHQQSD